MAYTELKSGANGPDVISLQTLLNRIGAMVRPDGAFGPGTQRAVQYAQKLAMQAQSGIADLALWTWLDQQPEPSTLLPANCVAFIAAEETGGLQYYLNNARFPQWPGEASGITVGIGYDLRMNTADDFRTTWSGLPAATITELLKDIGRPGTAARVAELKTLGIEIPFEQAWRAFASTSLPAYHALTSKPYPSLDTLPDKCRTTLISLVYNRGAAVTGTNREEMAAIQQLLVQAAGATLSTDQRKTILNGVADQLLSMRRLWKPTSGLVKRRETEANYWRQGLAEWQ